MRHFTIIESFCFRKEHNHATAFWSWVLLMSKVVELGDTAFIVLRKQNLMFLHWYHHVTTLMSWWVMYHWYEPNQLWYIVMNSFVHSLMYSYYALRVKLIDLFDDEDRDVKCFFVLGYENQGS